MFRSRSRQTQSPATGLTHFQKGLPRHRIIATKFKTAVFRTSRLSLCAQNSHKSLSTCYVNTETHTEVLVKTPNSDVLSSGWRVIALSLQCSHTSGYLSIWPFLIADGCSTNRSFKRQHNVRLSLEAHGFVQNLVVGNVK